MFISKRELNRMQVKTINKNMHKGILKKENIYKMKE